MLYQPGHDQDPAQATNKSKRLGKLPKAKNNLLKSQTNLDQAIFKINLGYSKIPGLSNLLKAIKNTQNNFPKSPLARARQNFTRKKKAVRIIILNHHQPRPYKQPGLRIISQEKSNQYYFQAITSKGHISSPDQLDSILNQKIVGIVSKPTLVRATQGLGSPLRSLMAFLVEINSSTKLAQLA